MKLNMYIIKDYLDVPIESAFLSEDKSAAHLSDTLLYIPEEVLRSDMLYVLSEEDFEKLRTANGIGHAHLIVCMADRREPNPMPTTQSFEALFVRECAPQKIHRSVQNIFNTFREWELKMFRLISYNASLKEVARAALPFLENPICLYTPSMRSIFFCGKEPTEKLNYYFGDKEGEYMSEKYFNNLRMNQNYTATISQTEPTLFPADIFGYRVLYYNIRENLVYQARLLVCETLREIRDSDYLILKILGNFLQKNMERKNMRVDNHPQNLDLFILRLLSGQQPTDPIYFNALSEFGWKLTDAYFCLHLPISRNDRATYSVKALCNHLEMEFGRSVCIVKGNAVIWIINLQQMQQPYEKVVAQALCSLSEQKQDGGISKPFSDLREIYTNYPQAVAAYTIGRASAPLDHYYFYEDYVLQDLLDRAIGSYSPASLCPQGLLDLVSYDMAHNVSYTKTLRTYLENNMRESQTSRALFMQRATLHHQITRIREISGLNLDDCSLRLRLLIVFQIIDSHRIPVNQLIERPTS